MLKLTLSQLSTMIAHLESQHHTENILQALETRTELEIEIFGSDNVRTDSSSLWLLSPLVRSVLASLRNIQELPALLIRNHKVGIKVYDCVLVIPASDPLMRLSDKRQSWDGQLHPDTGASQRRRRML